MRIALAQHRNAENRAEIAQFLRLDQGVFRISLYIGDMNRPDLQAARARSPSLVRARSEYL